MFSKETSTKDMETSLFVNNINESLTQEDVKDIFCKYGSCDVTLEKIPRSASCAYIHYSKPEEARAAIDKAQYENIKGNEIIVMYENDKNKLCQQGKIFIKNIHSDVQVRDLHDFFSKISPNLYASVLVKNGKKKDCGYVHFFNSDDAKKAMVQLQGEQLFNQKLKLEEWKNKDENWRKQIYIRNLHRTITKETIKSRFEEIKIDVVTVDLKPWKVDDEIKSLYGTIEFRTEEDAKMVLGGSLNKNIQDLFLWIYIKPYNPNHVSLDPKDDNKDNHLNKPTHSYKKKKKMNLPPRLLKKKEEICSIVKNETNIPCEIINFESQEEAKFVQEDCQNKNTQEAFLPARPSNLKYSSMNAKDSNKNSDSNEIARNMQSFNKLRFGFNNEKKKKTYFKNENKVPTQDFEKDKECDVSYSVSQDVSSEKSLIDTTPILKYKNAKRKLISDIMSMNKHSNNPISFSKNTKKAK